MNRIVTAALTAGIAAALTLVATPAFADVSNPASNPYKITVTGDDGQTYTDGQDTLPGYDDEACTYIPGAWFDFDNNRVHYPDGQSIPWTEWSRATGYQEWLAKKASQNTTTSNTSTGGSTSGTTSGGTTSSGTSTTTSQSGGKTTTQGGSGTAGAGTTSTNPTASPSESAGATASPEASEAIEVYSGEEAAASASPSEDAVVLADGSDAAQSGGGAQAAGLAILGILFALGGLGFGIYTVLNQRRSPKTQAI